MSQPAAQQHQGLSRNSNALECSLSFLSTWYGTPKVAQALIFDPADPMSLVRGEPNARERAEQWLGRSFEYVGPDASAYEVIAQRLRTGGPGAAAVIVNGWPPHLGTGSHAWNAYHHAESGIGWFDPLLGDAGDRPLYPEPYGVWAIFVDAGWRPPT